MSLSAMIKAIYANQGRSGALGTNVARAAAPDQVGPISIFTITGMVLITQIIGVVTVNRTGALATTLFTHSVGPTNLNVATPTIAIPANTMLAVTGNPLDNLVVGAAALAAIQGGMAGSANPGNPIQQNGMVMNTGNIRVTISVVTAGSTRYFLSYIPLDANATVVAA